MSQPIPLRHSPYLPFDPEVALYSSSLGSFTPYEFSDFRTEEESWKTAVYLHAGLNPASPYRLTGPDALRLLERACVNDFTRFSVGASKHAVMCNTNGHVMADGMVLRVGEEEFVSFFLNPYIDYLVATGDYDVTGQDLSGSLFLFQVGGPASLDIIQSATGEDFTDLEFIWHRESTIAHPTTGEPLPVRVFRLGVAGTLAYEVHGNTDDAPAVYEALMAAGADFGITRLGLRAYGLNHTENGFAQSFLHFLPAYTEDADFLAFLGVGAEHVFPRLPGSAGTDVSKRYFTPFELGWGHMVAFNHDFTGRHALQATPATRRPVTLIWNPEDVVAVYASQFTPGQQAQFMDFPANPIWTAHSTIVFADDVLHQGRPIGISSGRMFSSSYHSMISLAFLDEPLAQEGTQVEIIWGDPGTHQRHIRATVGRYPMLHLPKNRTIDLTRRPSPPAS